MQVIDITRDVALFFFCNLLKLIMHKCNVGKKIKYAGISAHHEFVPVAVGTLGPWSTNTKKKYERCFKKVDTSLES